MIDDKSLRDVLQRKIAQIKEYPMSAQKEVEGIMASDYNVKYSTTVDIFNGFLPLETMSYDMMYKLMTSIRKMILDGDRYIQLDASDLYAEKYFTDIEIKQFATPLENDNDDIDMVFKEWLQVNPDQYVCVVPIEQIIEWRNLNKIKYNPRTQRELTEKTTKGGVVIKVVTVFKEALSAIKKLMENNEFISDDITFNVNPEVNEEVPYIQRGSLIIPKKCSVDLIDGFHRYLEMTEVKDNDPDWNFNCIVNVMLFNEDKAHRFMIQKDKKNHLSEKQVRRFDKLNENNYVISRLNESSNFHHRGKITDDNFTFLVKLVEENFNPHSRIEAVELSKLLENNLNYVIENNNLYDIKLSPKELFIYFYITKYTKTTDEFINIIKKTDIQKLIKKINFRKEPSKNHYKILDELLKEVADHVL